MNGTPSSAAIDSPPPDIKPVPPPDIPVPVPQPPMVPERGEGPVL